MKKLMGKLEELLELGGLLEDLIVAKARAGIEKLCISRPDPQG